MLLAGTSQLKHGKGSFAIRKSSHQVPGRRSAAAHGWWRLVHQCDGRRPSPRTQGTYPQADRGRHHDETEGEWRQAWPGPIAGRSVSRPTGPWRPAPETRKGHENDSNDDPARHDRRRRPPRPVPVDDGPDRVATITTKNASVRRRCSRPGLVITGVPRQETHPRQRRRDREPGWSRQRCLHGVIILARRGDPSPRSEVCAAAACCARPPPSPGWSRATVGHGHAMKRRHD